MQKEQKFLERNPNGETRRITFKKIFEISAPRTHFTGNNTHTSLGEGPTASAIEIPIAKPTVTATTKPVNSRIRRQQSPLAEHTPKHQN